MQPVRNRVSFPVRLITLSRARDIRRRARAAQVIERLAALLPHTCALYENKRTPLAIGVRTSASLAGQLGTRGYDDLDQCLAEQAHGDR